ncbi:right-handed parallel beta-helix repeat-containing protein [Planomonospora parontospora]|uniref:right-handed parallel beta-helix repeat-containing protein n=1 Tax=Planomonospora parontospora TaxID=58119 RepID=UPI00167126B1|nr:right-handed parallel beta-helix repeat-containing protein [Planomonospora parontospora]GGL51555.1 hypothetical protein GCM10014719_61080 [Planomonospora parontospora subsp. antibiotica]GII20216.1 hypothetical protein Ppa05_69420 [Planomonospora parontospora subsp. antibiotica]
MDDNPLTTVSPHTVSGCTLRGWIADPNAGLWHGEAVQLDVAADGTAWAGLGDRTPCRDILLTANVCDASGSQAGWGQFTGSHTGVPIENNTVAGTRWDAIGTLNAQNVRITGNTVTGRAGGIYVKSIQDQPLATVEITGNRISGIGDRDALAIRTDAADAPITEAVVDGNTVDCAEVRYYGAVTPRAGAVLQCR